MGRKYIPVLDFDVKLKASFNMTKLKSAVMTAAERAIIRQAAAVMRIARNSMKQAGSLREHAAAGTPPLSHYGNYHGTKRGGELKKLLFYAWDQDTGSAVIGPVAFGGVSKSKPVPLLLEEGGTTSVFRKSKKRPNGYRYNRVVKPHPYMKPALEKSKERLQKYWSDALIKDGAKAEVSFSDITFGNGGGLMGKFLRGGGKTAGTSLESYAIGKGRM